MRNVLADQIERRLADGIYKTPEQEAQQLKRLRIIERAFEEGGEDAAYYADMQFCAGTSD